MHRIALAVHGARFLAHSHGRSRGMWIAAYVLGAMNTAPLELAIPIGDLQLAGTLSLPPTPIGFVIFVHSSGSSRFSPRNRAVADVLRAYELATLLLDLRTKEEQEIDGAHATLRLDVDMLAERLVAVTDSVMRLGLTLGLPTGYFGGTTGAAAALIAAARRPEAIAAIVSRGGRPDLAGAALALVLAPTLFIVGGDDKSVLELNLAAAKQMIAPRTVEIVPGATHLFEEPGALDEVGRLAARWFVRQFKLRPSRDAGRFEQISRT